MGFWGYLVVGRDDRPLPELYALRSYRPSIAANDTREDNWQVCSLHSDAGIADSVSLLVDIAAETHAPALMASVMDGDCASVEGFSGVDGYWRTSLAKPGGDECRVVDGVTLATLTPCVKEVAVRAARWAAAADRRVDCGPIAELFSTAPEPGTDSLFEELLTRLGLAGSADTSSEEIG